MNFGVFSSMSKINNHLDLLGVWQARIAGLWIAGQFVDHIVANGQIPMDAYQNVFGLYQAGWLLVFYLMLIWFFPNPLFLMFGIFAGLHYILTPAANYYLYPWDFPAMVFFTLNYLLWLRKKYLWMLLAIFVGCPFKETVAVTAVLFFFADLPVKKRIACFTIATLLVLLQKIAIMEILYGRATVVTQNFYSDPLLGFTGTIAWANLRELFALKWNHFIFVNAGTLVIALLLPARSKAQWGTKILLSVFLGCQFLAGSFNEFRIMLEMLPVSLLCIAEYANIFPSPPAAVSQTPTNAEGSEAFPA